MIDAFSLWTGFTVAVLLLLAFDLFLNRKAHVIGEREALLWSVFWIAVSLVFNLIVFVLLGPHSALEFFTGYLIEKALSVDNLFIFLVIFAYFNVPTQYQHRALYAGVLGAFVMRGIFITSGVELIKLFGWVVYIFGAFLIFSGIRIATQEPEEIHPERNPVLMLVRRYLRVTADYMGQKFFVRRNGLLLATPLLIVLIVIETTDIVFAVDSIPAILAITRDRFIVYSSNVFAILGLRSLYFALAGLRHHFYLLRYGLAFILVFVGGKMVAQDFVQIDIFVALGIVGSILLVTALASIVMPPKMKLAQPKLES